MARKGFSAEEAAEILARWDECDWDASSDYTGSEYEPVDSSGSLTDSDDEVEVPASARHTIPHVTGLQVAQDQPQGQQSGASAGLRFHGEAYTSNAAPPGLSTSTAVDPGEVSSNSMVVETGLVARAVRPRSQPRVRRARSTPILPEVLPNPNWQPPASAAPVVPPFTAQSGVQVETAHLGSALDFLICSSPRIS